MRPILRALVLLLAATTAAAKQPWEWTDEDRIAERLNPVSIRERASKEATEPFGVAPPRMPVVNGSRRSVTSNASSDVPMVIVGRWNPELFLAIELFPNLMRDAFAEDPAARARARGRLNESIPAGIAPEEFWSRLEVAASDFITHQRSEAALFRSLNRAKSGEQRAALQQQIKNFQQPQCRLRSEALLRAEAAVGRETLYRMLYQGVAPEVNMFSVEPETAQHLRFVVRGCQ
jgi:hypothetical protein